MIWCTKLIQLYHRQFKQW